MEAAMKAHRESCEAEFHRRATEYRDELLADKAKGASQLQTTVELLRSENLGLITQRNNQAMVDIQEQRKASQEAYENANLHKELHEINAEKERFRESYNRAVHEINRVTHENERMKNELSSTNYSPTSPPAQSHEQLNFGSPVFGTKATLFGRQSDPNQGTSAERSSFAPYKTGAFPIMSPVQGRDSNTTDPQARSTGPPEIVQQGWQQPGGAAGTVQQGWQSSWGPGSQGPAAHFGQGPPQGNAPSFQGFSPRSNPYGQGPAPGNEGNRSHNEGQDRG
jgi:hypothetical protein